MKIINSCQFFPTLLFSFRIASSVQKNIKEVLGNDGNTSSANDRLKAFSETATGKTVLGMAHEIMRDLNLTYTEQVFLQESGYSPAKVDGGKEEKKKSPTKGRGPLVVDSLLDHYQKMVQPVSCN